MLLASELSSLANFSRFSWFNKLSEAKFLKNKNTITTQKRAMRHLEQENLLIPFATFTANFFFK